MGEVGLEPTKAKPADLQSAPFAARDTPPSLGSAPRTKTPRETRGAIGAGYLAPDADMSSWKIFGPAVPARGFALSAPGASSAKRARAGRQAFR